MAHAECLCKRTRYNRHRTRYMRSAHHTGSFVNIFSRTHSTSPNETILEMANSLHARHTNSPYDAVCVCVSGSEPDLQATNWHHLDNAEWTDKVHRAGLCVMSTKEMKRKKRLLADFPRFLFVLDFTHIFYRRRTGGKGRREKNGPFKNYDANDVQLTTLYSIIITYLHTFMLTLSWARKTLL